MGHRNREGDMSKTINAKFRKSLDACKDDTDREKRWDERGNASKARQAAKLSARKKKITEVWYSIYSLRGEASASPSDESDEYMGSMLRDDVRRLADMQGDAWKGSPYVFITVNLKRDKDLPKLVQSVAEFTTRVWVGKCLYAFEQRADSKPYCGFHCHLMVSRRRPDNGKLEKPGRVQAAIKSAFGKYCSGSKSTLNVQSVTPGEEMRTANYIAGIKPDKKKAKKQLVDKKWRESIHLEDYYGDINPDDFHAEVDEEEEVVEAEDSEVVEAEGVTTEGSPEEFLLKKGQVRFEEADLPPKDHEEEDSEEDSDASN